MSKLLSKLSDVFKNQGGRFGGSEYDPETQYPAIRASICTGEKVAGFRDKKSGSFTEVMLIRSQKDIETFKERYHVDDLPTEYIRAALLHKGEDFVENILTTCQNGCMIYVLTTCQNTENR